MEELASNREFPNYLISPEGKVFSKYHASGWREMKPFRNNCPMGYLRISLIDADGKRRKIFLHRLVAETFIPNPEGYDCINHKDENVLNNSVSNLEWCTHAYNNNYGSHLEKCVPALLGAIEKMKVPVVGIDKEGKRYSFSSMIEAQNKTGAFVSNIAKCINGERKRAAGYRWEKEGEHNAILDGRR